MANWYATIDVVETGPMTARDLKQLARDGAITPDTLVRREDRDEPVRAGSVGNLFPEIVSPPTAGAPSPRGTAARHPREETIARREVDLDTMKPVSGRATFAVIALIITMAVNLLSIGSNVASIGLYERALDTDVPMTELEADDARTIAVGVVSILTWIVTASAFILWLRRVTANLAALGAGRLPYGTGWATGCWFVPFLNMWRPYQVVRQAAVESERAGGSPTPSVGPWWTVFIVMMLLSRIITRMDVRADTLDEMITTSWLWSIKAGISILAACLAILVVRGITLSQQQASDVDRVFD